MGDARRVATVLGAMGLTAYTGLDDDEQGTDWCLQRAEPEHFRGGQSRCDAGD